MRLRLILPREPKHTDIVTAVGWINSDELLSCSDDHQILKWNLVSIEATPFSVLPETLFPTDIHWFPRGLAGAAKKGGGSDSFVLTSTDG
jgi:intraflagellar transport protein 80